jgi:hypothetical protein
MKETKLKNISAIFALISSVFASVCSVCPLLITSIIGITFPSFFISQKTNYYFIGLTYIFLITSLYFWYREKQKNICITCNSNTTKTKNIYLYLLLFLTLLFLIFPVGALFLILFPTCAICPTSLVFISASGVIFYLKYLSSYHHTILFIIIILAFYFFYKRKNKCKNCGYKN